MARKRRTSWAKLEAEARRQMKHSAQAIEHSRNGVPSGKSSDWRVGKAPSSSRPKH